jgi:dTDP-4-dehydrorhamnose 3,5-epimerase
MKYFVYEKDKRGSFTKNFLKSKFNNFLIKEVYYAKSKKGVIRGMHYQNLALRQEKIISCLKGKILDVIIDIRKNSKKFGKFYINILDGKKNNFLHIKKGFAHGYLTLSKESLVLYFSNTEFKRNQDFGFKFDSFGFKWPVKKAILSKKDKNLGPLNKR